MANQAGSESPQAMRSDGRVRWGTQPFLAAQEVMFELGSED